MASLRAGETASTKHKQKSSSKWGKHRNFEIFLFLNPGAAVSRRSPAFCAQFRPHASSACIRSAGKAAAKRFLCWSNAGSSLFQSHRTNPIRNAVVFEDSSCLAQHSCQVPKYMITKYPTFLHFYVSSTLFFSWRITDRSGEAGKKICNKKKMQSAEIISQISRNSLYVWLSILALNFNRLAHECREDSAGLTRQTRGKVNFWMEKRKKYPGDNTPGAGRD